MAAAGGGSEELKEFERHGVIPDVIDYVPAQRLRVKWKSVEANMGEELTPTQVKDRPKLDWEAEDDAYYTVLMTDPDAPSRKNPKFGMNSLSLLTYLLTASLTHHLLLFVQLNGYITCV